MGAGIAMALSPKRQAFVDAYVGDARFNATEAARHAGYKQPQSQGPRLLLNVEVKKTIQGITEQAKKVCAMSREEWVIWLQGVALGQVMDVDTTLSGDVIEKLPKMSDRLKAVDLLGKFTGMQVDRLQVEGRLTVEAAEVPPALAKKMIRMIDAESKDVTNE